MRIISGYDSSKVVEEAQKVFNNKIDNEVLNAVVVFQPVDIQYQMINIDGKPFYSVLIY